MAPKRKEGRDRQRGDRGGAKDERVETSLEQLKRSFAEFRQENRPRMRIPDALRDAALEAIQGGTAEVEVIRACGISREQLNRWREVKWGYARRGKPKEAKVRVFPVVEDKISGPEHGGRESEEASSLQLRIGRWDICIRQNGS